MRFDIVFYYQKGHAISFDTFFGGQKGIAGRLGAILGPSLAILGPCHPRWSPARRASGV